MNKIVSLGHNRRICFSNLNHMTHCYPFINIYGPRRSGKSFLCKSLIEKYYETPLIIIISPTERFDHFYSNLNNIVNNDDFNLETNIENLVNKKGILIFNNFDIKIIQTLLKRQCMIHEINYEKRNDKVQQINGDVLLVMDDCLPNDRMLQVKELFSMGRNLCVSLIFTNHCILYSYLRHDFNYTYTYLLHSNINKKKIYNIYKNVFKDFEKFIKIYEELTSGYDAMVIYNNKANKYLNDKTYDHINEYIFYYNALQN